MDFLWWIIVGGIAGFLASKVVKSVKVSWIGAIVSGVLGAMLGGWLFRTAMPGGGLWSVFIAFIGAIIVLWIYSKISKR